MVPWAPLGFFGLPYGSHKRARKETQTGARRDAKGCSNVALELWSIGALEPFETSWNLLGSLLGSLGFPSGSLLVPLGKPKTNTKGTSNGNPTGASADPLAACLDPVWVGRFPPSYPLRPRPSAADLPQNIVFLKDLIKICQKITQMMPSPKMGARRAPSLKGGPMPPQGPFPKRDPSDCARV